MAAQRLTEEEVHEACAEIAAQGERPTVLNVYDRLGRGSLTTITKYFNTWKASDEAQAFRLEDLPAVVKLPEELSNEGEGLMKRIWNVAKGLADAELEIQREALRQAEHASMKKVEEEFAIRKKSEVQLANEEKNNVALSKDNEQLRHEIDNLRNQVASLEEANKAVLTEQRQLQTNHVEEIKRKDDDIHKLDIQAGKLQSSLDTITKAHNDLKADVKLKDSELSKQLVELENLRGKYESALVELTNVKTDLQALNQAVSKAEKLVANLEGQLAVYKSLDLSAKNDSEDAQK